MQFDSLENKRNDLANAGNPGRHGVWFLVLGIYFRAQWFHFGFRFIGFLGEEVGKWPSIGLGTNRFCLVSPGGPISQLNCRLLIHTGI